MRKRHKKFVGEHQKNAEWLKNFMRAFEYREEYKNRNNTRKY